jgi:hypothetical protein
MEHFYGTQTNWIQSTPSTPYSCKIHFTIILSCMPNIPNCCFHWGFRTKFCVLSFPHFFYRFDEVRLCLCGTGPLLGPLSIPQMIREWIQSNGGVILTGENRRTRRKTCPSATLSTTDPTWTSFTHTWYKCRSSHPSWFNYTYDMCHKIKNFIMILKYKLYCDEQN